MRLLLAILAVLGLLASPVVAAAAQGACSQALSGVASTGMGAMAGAHRKAGMASDLCCDHSAKPGGAKSCAQSCAATCAVAAALPGPFASVPFQAAPPERTLAVALTVQPFEPSGLERPPKSMA